MVRIVSLFFFMKTYLIGISVVVSKSMENTLKEGDIVLIIKPLMFESFWPVKNGDIIGFNYAAFPRNVERINFSLCEKSYVKRVIASPGDSLSIKKNKVLLYDNNELKWRISPLCINPSREFEQLSPVQHNHKFFFDTLWSYTIKNPIYLPKKGDYFISTPYSIKLHQKYEVTNLDPLDLEVDQLNYSYYFVLGDNYYNSFDSRNWGPLPKPLIVGKIPVILFSYDKEATFLKKIRWKRIFKILE